jgi:hypothetical protein
VPARNSGDVAEPADLVPRVVEDHGADTCAGSAAARRGDCR